MKNKKTKNRWFIRLAGLLLASYTAFAVTAMAVDGAGSESDPLVTLSYLNETFMAQLLGKVDEKLAVRDQALADKLNEQVRQDMQELSDRYGTGTASPSEPDKSETFTVVTLSNGQALYGGVGCEVMLRVGTANCVAPSSPGLIDETDGTTLNGGGALVKNHLYMITIDGDRGVKATAATVKLLVRGDYAIL